MTNRIQKLSWAHLSTVATVLKIRWHIPYKEYATLFSRLWLQDPFFSLPNDKEKKAVWPHDTSTMHLCK